MRTERNRYLVPFNPIGEYKNEGGTGSVINFEKQDLTLLEDVIAGQTLKTYGGKYASNLNSLTNKKVKEGNSNFATAGIFRVAVNIESGRSLILYEDATPHDLYVGWGVSDFSDENTINIGTASFVYTAGGSILYSDICKIDNNTAIVIFYADSSILYSVITWDVSYNLTVGTVRTLDTSAFTSGLIQIEYFNSLQIVVSCQVASTTRALIVYSLSGDTLTKESSEYTITSPATYNSMVKSYEDVNIGFICFFNNSTGTDIIQFTVNTDYTINLQTQQQIMTGLSSVYFLSTHTFKVYKIDSDTYIIIYGNSASTYYLYSNLYIKSTNTLGTQNAMMTNTSVFYSASLNKINENTFLCSANSSTRMYFCEMWHDGTVLSFSPQDYISSLSGLIQTKYYCSTNCYENFGYTSSVIRRIKLYNREGIALETGTTGDTISVLTRIE